MNDALIEEWLEHPTTRHLMKVLESQKAQIEQTLLGGSLLGDSNAVTFSSRAVGRYDIVNAIVNKSIFEVKIDEESTDED